MKVPQQISTENRPFIVKLPKSTIKPEVMEQKTVSRLDELSARLEHFVAKIKSKLNRNTY